MIYINLVCFSILSAAITILMAKVTNKRIEEQIIYNKNKDETESIDNIKKEDDLKEQKNQYKLYQWNIYTIICFVIGVVFSIVCGYQINLNTISITACIELEVCYLGVLGAAIIDFKLKIIPNYISLILITGRIFIFIYELFFIDFAIEYLISSFLGCFLCGIVLLISSKIVSGGIGMGDIKLLSTIGFLCGVYAVFSTLLLALVSCMAASILLLLVKKRNKKDYVAFGPYIYIGYVVMILLTWY